MSLALYRRYRPESFADVVGQEHVTEPLMQALRSGRVNHAYLFSGPRGCGKTTSARILARCLNCEQGPTPTPCGVCPSCVELARGGSGSLDVIEIDAASHGGVDDARDLRDRVAMAPVRDRFRVYIIDEAHMVSTQGFNALLKVVEEPPEHVKFVFATTEPDKVLQTIRSRTHHYAFRLVPPGVLVDYLGTLCEAESVPAGAGVLPLVVRAGQGSVRDSLSVLDQLIAGAGGGGLEYTGALALLGYTDEALLDDIVDALAEADGASLFEVVNRVIESGHDPRRFVEDLLERLRDLILVQAMGAAADGVLRATPPDQLDRMRAQAARLGPAELSRGADITNAALAEMVGASSPRIHLELLCARLMLPAADDGARGLAPRLDRLERGLGGAAAVPAAAGSAAPAASGRPWRDQPAAAPPPAESRPAESRPTESRPAESRPTVERPAESRPAVERPPVEQSAGGAAGSGGVDTERLRRSWPEVLGEIQGRRRATWMALSNAGVHELVDGVLRLSFANQGTARGFANGHHGDVVAEAVQQLFGVRVRVEPHVGPTGPSQSAPAQSAQSQSQSQSSQAQSQARSRPAQGRSAAPPSTDWPTTVQPPTSDPAQANPTRAQADRPPAERDPGTRESAPTPSEAPADRPRRPSPQVSSADAWGVPFGDEPPPDDAPPDDLDAREAAPRRAAREAAPVERDARQAPPQTPPPQTPPPQSPPPAVEPPSAPAPPVDRQPAVEPPKRLSRIERLQREQLNAQAGSGETAASRADDIPSADDADAADAGQVGPAVVERLLGGKVIDVQDL